MMHWPKRVPESHKHISEKHLTFLSNHIYSRCSKVYTDWTRDKVIPKTMEARNSQNTRLAKKKGSCRISIVRWAQLLGYTSWVHVLGTRLGYTSWVHVLGTCLGYTSWVHVFTALESAPTPYCTLRSRHEPRDRNHLGQYTAISDGTECERYWEARTKMMENRLCSFSITIFVTTCH
jgi:hypothetical protein